jgi:hypothetical protein
MCHDRLGSFYTMLSQDRRAIYPFRQGSRVRELGFVSNQRRSPPRSMEEQDEDNWAA